MKRSEFLTSLAAYFDPWHSQAILHDLALPLLGSRTAGEALEAGVDPQLIWDAVRTEMGLPGDASHPHRAERTS